MTPGHSVELLVDGERAFPSMLEAISSARRTVLMNSYIFNDDQIGRQVADALAERAREGVAVFLIVDGLGTINVPESFFDEMRVDGVSVLEYRPVAFWKKGWGILRRDHRKLLVVDGRVGFAGGLNVGDEWIPAIEGGQGWHDIHVRVEGPAVRDLSKLAMVTWRQHGGVNLDPRIFLPDVEQRGETLVNIIGSRERKKRKAIMRSYLHAIKNARDYIYMANAYFIPGAGFRRALANAARRGVDVRVMIPASGDIFPAQMASQALYSRLMRRGIKIYLWQKAVLHAKTAVIDGQWSTVGSYNIDRRSWTSNLEVNVNVLDEGFAGILRSVFVEDQDHCTRLTLEEWRQRPLLQKLLERFFFQFRKFM